jgi:hypothetical protein
MTVRANGVSIWKSIELRMAISLSIHTAHCNIQQRYVR